MLNHLPSSYPVARPAWAALVAAMLIPAFALTASGQTLASSSTDASTPSSLATSDLAIATLAEITTDRGPVDSPVRRLRNSPRPSYPADLSGQPGRVVTEFVVDATGHIDLGSITVVQSSDPAFATAVLDVLPRIRFVAALDHGQAVDQKVRMPFVFTGAHLAGSL